MKRKTKLTVLALLIMLMVVIGTSYSFFAANISYVNKTNTKLVSNTLGLNFKGKTEVINCSNIVPGDKCIKTFDVENTSNVATYYNIYMEDVSNGFDSDLVYTLKEGNTEVISETVAPTTAQGKTYIKVNISIPASPGKHEYTLALTFKYDASKDQNVNQGKEFHATVGIDTEQISGTVAVMSGKTISVSSLENGVSVTKKFTVKNTSDEKKKYDITLANVENTYDDLTFSVTANGTEVVSTTAMPTTDTKIVENKKIDAGATDTYVMTINYLETGTPSGTESFTANIETTSKAYVREKCQRANVSTLHTELCNSEEDEGCQAAGIAQGATVTYGNQNTTPGILTAGDAFDCDINGDGTYDPEDERFYYVSTATNGATTDSNTAVLIYYKDYSTGASKWAGSYNRTGPSSAIWYLPTINQWATTLVSATRNITYENGVVRKSEFQYKQYEVDLAARLLTTQELESACNITVGTYVEGELDTCTYLMENTQYAKDTVATTGLWLENAHSLYESNAWVIVPDVRGVRHNSVSNMSNFKSRPVIEVAKTDIEY